MAVSASKSPLQGSNSCNRLREKEPRQVHEEGGEIRETDLAPGPGQNGSGGGGAGAPKKKKCTPQATTGIMSSEAVEEKSAE